MKTVALTTGLLLMLAGAAVGQESLLAEKSCDQCVDAHKGQLHKYLDSFGNEISKLTTSILKNGVETIVELLLPAVALTHWVIQRVPMKERAPCGKHLVYRKEQDASIKLSFE